MVHGWQHGIREITIFFSSFGRPRTDMTEVFYLNFVQNLEILWHMISPMSHIPLAIDRLLSMRRQVHAKTRLTFSSPCHLHVGMGWNGMKAYRKTRLGVLLGYWWLFRQFAEKEWAYSPRIRAERYAGFWSTVIDAHFGLKHRKKSWQIPFCWLSLITLYLNHVKIYEIMNRNEQ